MKEIFDKVYRCDRGMCYVIQENDLHNILNSCPFEFNKREIEEENNDGLKKTTFYFLNSNLIKEDNFNSYIRLLDGLGIKYKYENKVIEPKLFRALNLSERELNVLILRWSGRTLEDTGREFNITRERVRQIEARAIRKCWCYFREKLSNEEILKRIGVIL